METDFESTLKKLNEQVSHFTKNKSSPHMETKQQKFGFTTPKIDMSKLSNSNAKYLMLPLVVLVILLIVRPNFVKKDVVKQDGTKVKKLCMRRLLLAVLLISMVIGLGYMLMMYKKGVHTS